ncbi:rev protein [Simian immunodeficiency virus]|uniref:Protein Rev n=1 Tax=Simian immunodeficiency virus TaxID=11723 RepID=Q699W3_SIV|nr:rev protein [Simian immunodeficiency virus]
MAHAGGRGSAEENTRQLLKVISLIKILYQSIVSRIFPFADPYPKGGGSASTRRRRRQKWRRRQGQVDSIAERILQSHLGGSPTTADVALPDLSQLHLAD